MPVVRLSILQLHQLKEAGVTMQALGLAGQRRGRGHNGSGTGGPGLTMGWFCAVFSNDRGSCGEREKGLKNRDTGTASYPHAGHPGRRGVPGPPPPGPARPRPTLTIVPEPRSRRRAGRCRSNRPRPRAEPIRARRGPCGANQRTGPGLGRKASPRLPVRSVTTVP